MFYEIFKDNTEATDILLPDVSTEVVDKWLYKVYNRVDIGHQGYKGLISK